MKLKIAILSTALVFAACKSAPTTDNPQTKAERSAVKCDSNPPTRIEYREDGNIIESQGPIELAVQSCDAIAKDATTRATALKTGKWTNYHPQGDKVQSTGNFSAGKREGLWETFSENGNLTKVASYKAGKQDGEEILYFDTPEKIWKSKGAFVAGVKNGAWSERRAADATCVTEGTYDTGKKTGKWRECKAGPGGADYLHFDGAYQSGLKSGPIKFFYPGAVLQSQGVMKADMECFAKLSDADKQASDKIEQCAKPIGKWVFYHSTGSKHSEGSYDNGRKTGAWREYYKTGTVVASGNYTDNKKSGEWSYLQKGGGKHADIQFAENGITPKKVKLYEAGRLVASGEIMMGSVKYDMEKDELETREFTKKGVWIEYHTTGKKSGEGEFSMNKRKGPWKHYDENGKLIAEGIYSMGEKQGVWKELSGGSLVDKTYFMGKLKP